MEVNFKAKHIATTKNIYKNFSTRIDIYELSKRDKPFLEKLKKQAKGIVMIGVKKKVAKSFRLWYRKC